MGDRECQGRASIYCRQRSATEIGRACKRMRNAMRCVHGLQRFCLPGASTSIACKPTVCLGAVAALQKRPSRGKPPRSFVGSDRRGYEHRMQGPAHHTNVESLPILHSTANTAIATLPLTNFMRSQCFGFSPVRAASKVPPGWSFVCRIVQ